MNGTQVFSKLDLLLAEESRYNTASATHKGLHRYKKLNFGTNSASELFQKIIHDQINDIPGAINISDDVIVYGKSQHEHDIAFHAACQRFSQVGLTLNHEKIERVSIQPKQIDILWDGLFSRRNLTRSL